LAVEVLQEFLCLLQSVVGAEDPEAEAAMVVEAMAVEEAGVGVTHLKLLNREPSFWYCPGRELFSLVIANTDSVRSLIAEGKTKETPRCFWLFPAISVF
jgi:hypothetical protein